MQAVEETIRELFPDVDERREFRTKWPMYDRDSLATALERCDEDLARFEDAITKVRATKRNYLDMIDLVVKRDKVLDELKRRQGNGLRLVNGSE